MKIQVALNLHSKNNAQLVANSDIYTINMTDNAYFLAPDMVALIKTTKTATLTMRNAMNAPTSDTKNDTIKGSRDALERYLSNLKNGVESVANNPTISEMERISIVHSAGMSIKQQPRPQARIFSVKQGNISGSVVLTAQGGASANEWQYTEDTVNFTNRISLPTTTTAKTQLEGLLKKTDYAFFHKAIIAGENTDWEDPIIFTVL